MNQKPVSKEYRRIDIIMCTTTKNIDVYKVENLIGDLSMGAHVNRVLKKSLLSVINPRYSDIIRKYLNLKGIEMDDRNQ